MGVAQQYVKDNRVIETLEEREIGYMRRSERKGGDHNTLTLTEMKGEDEKS